MTDHTRVTRRFSTQLSHYIPLSSLRFQASCKNYGFISYRTNEQGQCCVTDYSPLTNEETFETRELLSVRLTRHLQDVEIQAK